MNKEEYIYLAKVAEQAERYDEMLDYMKHAVHLGRILSVEERNLLSVAYKNVIGCKRAAWRILVSLEQKEENKGEEKKVEVIKKVRKRVEEEIKRVCDDVEEIVGFILEHNDDFEGLTFFWKMRADYKRYLAEFSYGEERRIAAQDSLRMYNEAQVCASNLKPTNPIQLGLGLNLSVFYYEILNDPERACNLAKETFDRAIAELDQLSEEDYKDSTLIMQLMRDGLTLWTSDAPGEEDEELNIGRYHA